MLKNLSKEEAILFNKIAGFALTDDRKKHFIIDTTKILAIEDDISYADIITLIDLGLLSNPEASAQYMIPARSQTQIFYGDRVIFIENAGDEDRNLQFKITPFTSIGSALLNLTENSFNLKYLEALHLNLLPYSHLKMYTADITVMGVNGYAKARINGAGFDPLIAAEASKIGPDLRASMRACLECVVKMDSPHHQIASIGT